MGPQLETPLSVTQVCTLIQDQLHVREVVAARHKDAAGGAGGVRAGNGEHLGRMAHLTALVSDGLPTSELRSLQHTLEQALVS